MKRQKIFFTAITFGWIILPQVAFANPEIQGGISLKAGTLGAGIEYTSPLFERVAVRFGINGFSYDKNIEESGVNYDGELKLMNISAIADFHPWGNAFRLSAGGFYNGNSLAVTAKPSNETFEFNDKQYHSADVSASGDIEFNSISPYIGVGWVGALANNTGWSFSAELGVMYHGEPDVSLSASCGTGLNSVICTQLKNDVAVEQGELQNELSDFKWFPVASVAITYRF